MLVFSFYRRKQIDEISNNIEEARRIFENLESDTRRLVLVGLFSFSK
jgi:archaellum component FlaC